ncbi:MULTISPECIES: GGDEF domain-containing protein [unclassified Marinomonas]|uniref:GGDEF domain-containing protein n=1 Tax=unclassified Marinomonas TaxID=196814 RepID=UPI0007AF249A|nr:MULTISPECIES: GGDEF domain-containing protein [unclassified Marinomonas]
MSLSDLISIGMTLGTGIIILANIILMNLVAYYREEQDSLKVFCISFMIFGVAWVLYISRIFDFFYVPISLAAAFYYAAIIIYYIATSRFLRHAINYYLIAATLLAYCIIYWSPGASDDISLRSYGQALVSGCIHSYFAFIYYKQFKKEKNIGHFITLSAHFIILLIEILRCYLLLESIEPMLILGIVVVAHTISLILNNIGIMTAFSFNHYKAVRSLSKKDSLTGLLNRRGFFELYQAKSCRYQEVAIISCDIDYFKTINDNHGHSYGDQILEQIAHELKEHTKLNFTKESLVARWGGEEFVIALFDCSINQARALADTLRENIHNNEYEINQDSFRISLSFGVAHHQVNANGIEHLIRQSDKALYQAKLLGRNQVACHT